MIEGWPITITDIVVLGVLFISAILAYFRGFTKEVLSILSWVGAAIATVYGYPLVLPYAHKLTDIAVIANFGAGIAVFVVGLILLSIVSGLISGAVKDSAAGPLDKALGFVFGIVRGAFIVCLVYIGATWIWDSSDLPPVVRESRSFPAVEVMSGWLVDAVPDAWKSEGAKKADQAKDTVEDAKRLKETYDVLKQPQPATGTTGGNANDEGYSNGERKQLDKLFEQTE